MNHPTPTTLIAVTRALPGGDVTAFVDAAGVVRAAGYGMAEEMAARLLTRDLAGAAWRLNQGGHSVADALERYAAGEVEAFDGVAVRQEGTPLMQATWDALRRIAPGATVTYAQLAELAGVPRAVRAVASACARNRVAPFVPCHRAVRAGGGLGGYAYGLPVKEALLAHEAASR